MSLRFPSQQLLRSNPDTRASHVDRLGPETDPILFVPPGAQPGATGELTSSQDDDQQHHNTQHTVHHAQMHQAEHVQSLVTPSVRFVESRRVVRPLDLQDPVVAEGEPHHQEEGEAEGGHPRPS